MFKTIFSLFAAPLGAMVNNALAAGSGALILYGAQHGVDATISGPIVGGLALLISQIISGVAASQGIQIPIINADKKNGVVVVPATDSNVRQAVDAPKP